MVTTVDFMYNYSIMNNSGLFYHELFRLNIIIGSFVGVFIGHGLYVLWDLKTRPELYAMQSAPWYLTSELYKKKAILTLAR